MAHFGEVNPMLRATMLVGGVEYVVPFNLMAGLLVTQEPCEGLTLGMVGSENAVVVVENEFGEVVFNGYLFAGDVPTHVHPAGSGRFKVTVYHEHKWLELVAAIAGVGFVAGVYEEVSEFCSGDSFTLEVTMPVTDYMNMLEARLRYLQYVQSLIAAELVMSVLSLMTPPVNPVAEGDEFDDEFDTLDEFDDVPLVEVIDELPPENPEVPLVELLDDGDSPIPPVNPEVLELPPEILELPDEANDANNPR